MPDFSTALRDHKPRTAIILGSGLGGLTAHFDAVTEVAYTDLPGWPVASVPGHAGRLTLALAGKTPVLLAQGRSHLYEGLTAREVTGSVRMLAQWGVKNLVLTNAAGALEPSFQVGALMLIRDHLNLQGQSPLTGGATFCDLTEVYDRPWRDACVERAAALDLRLHQGVYAAVPGPQYETPAEVRMLQILGAHAVGMSTVQEAIQARALGLRVLALSMLTNWAAGLSPAPLDHREVLEVGQAAAQGLGRLLHGLTADDAAAEPR